MSRYTIPKFVAEFIEEEQIKLAEGDNMKVEITTEDQRRQKQDFLDDCFENGDEKHLEEIETLLDEMKVHSMLDGLGGGLVGLYIQIPNSDAFMILTIEDGFLMNRYANNEQYINGEWESEVIEGAYEYGTVIDAIVEQVGRENCDIKDRS